MAPECDMWILNLFIPVQFTVYGQPNESVSNACWPKRYVLFSENTAAGFHLYAGEAVYNITDIILQYRKYRDKKMNL